MWRVAVGPSCIQDARFLKVKWNNYTSPQTRLSSVIVSFICTNSMSMLQITVFLLSVTHTGQWSPYNVEYPHHTIKALSPPTPHTHYSRNRNNNTLTHDKRHARVAKSDSFRSIQLHLLCILSTQRRFERYFFYYIRINLLAPEFYI